MGFELLVNANYDFVGYRKVMLGITGVIIAGFIASMATKGLNWGVEFTGGSQIEVNFDEAKQTKVAPTIDTVRAAVTAAGIEGAQVVTVGPDEERAFLIRAESAAREGVDKDIETAVRAKFGDKVTYYNFDPESQDRAVIKLEDESVTPDAVRAAITADPALAGLGIEDVTKDKADGSIVVKLQNPATDILTSIDAQFGAGTYDSSIDAIGAAVSKDLTRKALLAILLACVLIGIYVWLRFDVDFAPGVIIALIHDSIVVLGVWSVFGFEFNLTIVAAVLAIIGYSVNDTVVIYDRIRENLEKNQSRSVLWNANRAVNETLSRTFLTSGATLLSVFAIALLGSEAIRWFGWAMVVGIVSGTWSTIAVAMPVTMFVYELRERQRLDKGAPTGGSKRVEAKA